MTSSYDRPLIRLYWYAIFRDQTGQLSAVSGMD